MVKVQKGRLGAFQHYLLAGIKRLVHEAHRVPDHRGQGWRDLVEVLRGDLVAVNGKTVVDLCQDGVLFAQDHVELLTEDLRVEQVLDT